MSKTVPMSDENRRWVCRISFLLCCLLPTGLVVYLILHPYSPKDWEQLVEAKLGMRVSVDSVERTGPWTSVLRGVTLFGDAPHQTLSATEVLVSHGAELEIHIEQPLQLTTSMAKTIGQAIERKALLGSPLTRETSVRARQIKLSDRSQTDTCVFQNVQWVLGPTSDGKATGTRFEAEITPPDSAPSRDASKNLVVYFERSLEDNETIFHLNTSNRELDGWVLSEFLPDSPPILARSRFSGLIEANARGVEKRTTVANIQGYLKEVPIETLETTPGLSGKAQISIQNCELVNGKIRNFNIRAICENGSLSTEFLRFVEQDLALAVNLPPSGFVDNIPYSRMAFNARLSNGVLHFVPVDDQAIAVSDLNGQPLVAWRAEDPSVNLSEHLIQSPATGPRHSVNRTVEILSLFDLPTPLPVRVASQPDNPPGYAAPIDHSELR